MSETWIVFKSKEMSAEGWEQRLLMPSHSCTDLLAEQWDYSGKLPQVGDRVREYANLSDPDNGVTHGRDGDWVISGVQQFSSFDTDARIVVCHCEYQPIEANWQKIKRGIAVSEMLETAGIAK
jgi:hypothetical protein